MSNIVGISDPRPDLNSLVASVQALREQVQILSGERGQPQDRAATIDDLINFRLLEANVDANWDINSLRVSTSLTASVAGFPNKTVFWVKDATSGDWSPSTPQDVLVTFTNGTDTLATQTVRGALNATTGAITITSQASTGETTSLTITNNTSRTPQVTVSHTLSGVTVPVTFLSVESGTAGADGADGADGDPGADGSDGFIPPGITFGGRLTSVALTPNRDAVGNEDAGEVRLTPGRLLNPDGTFRTLSAANQVNTPFEGSTRPPTNEGSFYLLWGASSPVSRFGGTTADWGSTEAVNAGWFTAYWYNNQWTAIDNAGTTYNFSPIDTDVAMAIGFKTSSTGGIDSMTQVVPFTGLLGLFDSVPFGALDDNVVDTQHIIDAAIEAAQIAANAVTETAIANLAVTSPKIAVDAVQTVNIAPLAITSVELSADAVRAQNILDGSITAAKVADDAITNRTIAASAITANEIALGTITAVNIAPDAITSDLIADGTIAANNIASGAITTTTIAGSAITAPLIAAGAVVAGKIAAGAVTAGTIAAGSITGDRIAANAISAGLIAADAVIAGKIAAGAVEAGTIAAGAITANDIAAGSITGDRIAANTLTAGQIAANAISTSELAAGAVTATNIAANTITASQMAANSITSVQLAANSVVAGRIAAGAVTAGTIAANAVTAGTVAANAITAGTIATNAVTAAKIQAGAVTADKIAVANLAAITADMGTITAGSISAALITSGILAAGRVSASNITTGTLSASRISIDNVTLDTNGSGQLIISSGGVDTGQLAANASTKLNSAYTYAETVTSNHSTWNTIQTLALTTSGGDLAMDIGFIVRDTVAWPKAFYVRVLRGATVVLEIGGASAGFGVFVGANGTSIVSLPFEDTPSAGTYTYTLQIYKVGSGGVHNLGFSSRSLRATELKR